MEVRLGVVAMALVIATGASPLPERTPAQITKQERDVLDMVRDRLARFKHTWRPGWGPCRDPQMQEAADVATVTLRADTSTAFMADFARQRARCCRHLRARGLPGRRPRAL